jgi:hypothetical protein
MLYLANSCTSFPYGLSQQEMWAGEWRFGCTSGPNPVIIRIGVR